MRGRKDPEGKCPDTSKFGCNQLVHKLEASGKWSVEILPKKDHVSGGGLVQIVKCKAI
jgi:hypothetical protein